MKHGRKILAIVAFLCLALVVYRNVAGEKERKRTPEDGTDSEFYLYFGEDDVERIDKIILRKLGRESGKIITKAELEIIDPDVIREIAEQVWTLTLTEDETAEDDWIGENKMIISFNTAGPDLTLYVGPGNRLKRQVIACDPDTKMTVSNSVFIMEPELHFDELWEMTETVISENVSEHESVKAEIPAETSESGSLTNSDMDEEAPAEQSVDGRNESLSLPDAPYLAYLDQYAETGIEVDMRLAKDMGQYYVVPGVLKHPTTFNEEQRLAMDHGEAIELVVNEVSGETKMLRKNRNAEQYFDSYVLYEKGGEADGNPEIVNAWINMDSGVHTLWQASDDTIMKPVYEGEIYILKGAVSGAHVSLELASEDQREIVIPDQDAKEWESVVYGNYLRHDGRGYFTAVYYLGD